MEDSKFLRAIEMAKEGYGRIIIARELNLDAATARAAVNYVKMQSAQLNFDELDSDDLKVDAAMQDFEDGIDDSIAPLVIEGTRIGVLSDIHFPRHDKPALTEALRQLVKFQPTTIYLNGDIMDAERISRFSKLPMAELLSTELRITRDFLDRLRKIFPDAKIYYKEGNHEKRFADYVLSNAAELYGLVGMTLAEQLDLDGMGIVHVQENRIAHAGKLWIVHGHEYKSMFHGGIYHARNTRIKAGVNVLMGHWHRTQTDIDTKLDGKQIGGWATGCLCKLNPAWAGQTKWTHGFATVRLDGDAFHVDNIRM